VTGDKAFVEKIADWNIKGRLRCAGFSCLNRLSDLRFVRHLPRHIEVPPWCRC